MRYIIFVFSIVFTFIVGSATGSANLGNYFQGYKGTFVIRDLSTNEVKIYNEELANKRIAPQSTFKVLNALVGLQTGVVGGEGHLKKWDGVISSYSANNRDHTLASAMTNSVVWYFKDMARNIGEDRMHKWIDQVGYGNGDISGGIDQFWLESSLFISPIEQVNFIAKLYKEDLPFDKSVIQTVKKIITLEQDDNHIFAGKTGTKSNLGGGWFVGYISCKNKTYTFATYIDGPNASGPIARGITERILHDTVL